MTFESLEKKLLKKMYICKKAYMIFVARQQLKKVNFFLREALWFGKLCFG